MLVPNRHEATNEYQYGFNGHEKDDEIKGEGNSVDYGFRMHDPRVGRWSAVDPLGERGPQYSPYCYGFNNPMYFTDPDGRWPDLPIIGGRIGFNIGFNGRNMSFNVTASIGVEHRTPNFQAVAFASASIYGGQQLGTSRRTPTSFDITAGVYASVGNGTATPHNFYTLNYNTASPFNNTFDSSVTYGQMLTYNSAINKAGDGPGIQSEGLLGMRFGENFSLSSNNDAETYGSYLLFNKKNKTDAGWTGGIVVNAGGVEFGYQNFSGYWKEFAAKNKKGETVHEFGYVFSAENRSSGNGVYHQQLNKAFNFIRIGNATQGVYSDAWFQRAIHEHFSNNGTYNYTEKGKSQGSVGNN